VDDLVRWLGEQLDEDERIARALVDDKRPGRADPWEFCDDGSIRDTSRHGSLRVKFTWAPEAEHIIRHDPARVLREIDAKRKLMERMATTLAVAEGDTEVDHYGALDDAETALCLLALPYADRPGYREEWRP
jgi:hypothetical protein